jgi:ubiquinol-cytochrome c reductase iron-sulfur subunit
MSMGTVQRRRIMLVAGAGAVASGAAVLLGSIGTFNSYPHGAPLAIGLGELPEGKLLTVEWQGLPVWVLRRSAADVATLAAHEDLLVDPNSRQSLQPRYCQNLHRSLRPELFVAVGLCTHQGCSPTLLGSGGFLCPCHASKYDLAGRVFKVGPASANLVIPAYRFEAEDKLMLGVDS